MGLARATYERILKDVDLPENQYKVIKSHHIHKANMPVYCSRYVSGEDVLDLSADLNFPPCLLMRRMLELLLKLSKQRVSDVLKDPSQLQSMTDRGYSPFCDMAKSLAGLEFEARLYQQLQEAEIPYWNEQQLREKGLFKTPDALLQQVPICVCCCGEGTDQQWHVVHWIDSKASFGDDRMHSQQLDGQYRTYINRYGPGLVIYWFGFIQGLENDPELMLAAEGPQVPDNPNSVWHDYSQPASG
eukprot:gene10604-10762_t